MLEMPRMPVMPCKPPDYPEPAFPDVSLPALAAETQVVAFYHANTNIHGYRFVRVSHEADIFPISGLSSGWLRGTVTKAWDPELAKQRKEAGDTDAMYLEVNFSGRFRDTLGGWSEGLDMNIHAGLVRLADAAIEVPPVLLSVCCVRWWDYWSNEGISDFNVTSDGLILDLMDGPCGLYPRLAGEFEVHSVFIKSSSDLDNLSGNWAQAVLRGRNSVAWYFLWPVLTSTADRTGGCVFERRFFAMCQRMERAGIRSGWPHPSHLYRNLCGKLWIPQMSIDRACRVPPTTRVTYADVLADVGKAAERALEALMAIRREVWGKPPVPFDEYKGVVKLGFSWQGNDVLPFRGVENLGQVMNRLLAQTHSEQDVCLVQEMVQDVACEHRIFCFHDAVNGTFVGERLWMTMRSKTEGHHNRRLLSNVEDFALASAHVITREEAIEEFFKGDSAALCQAEAGANALVERWLLWFSAECCDPPPVARLDFLIAHGGGEGGGPSAWTCEVCECGGSLCSIDCDARNAAALNWAVRDDPAGRFPMPLPAIQRNNGWKS